MSENKEESKPEEATQLEEVKKALEPTYEPEPVDETSHRAKDLQTMAKEQSKQLTIWITSRSKKVFLTSTE